MPEVQIWGSASPIYIVEPLFPIAAPPKVVQHNTLNPQHCSMHLHGFNIIAAFLLPAYVPASMSAGFERWVTANAPAGCLLTVRHLQLCISGPPGRWDVQQQRSSWQPSGAQCACRS